MAVKAKIGAHTTQRRIAPPKKSRQGNGQHSRPRGTRKLLRGQGR